jgi:hypothetical protein
VNLAHAQAVAHATPIDAIEAKRLSTQTTALTPEQVLSLEQWHLAQFYRLNSIAATDVLFDKNGATQTQIKNLEAALSHAKAVDRTATSINRNAEHPQDWDKAAVRHWLLEQAGMTTFIAQIVAEEIEKLTAEITQPIAQFVRNHAAEFRIGFGVVKIDALSDQQIVGMLLATCGIATRRQRRGSIYRIDQERLVNVLSVLNRRQQTDPQGVTNDVRQDGWIRTNHPQNQQSPPQKVEPIDADWGHLGIDGADYQGDDYSLSA